MIRSPHHPKPGLPDLLQGELLLFCCWAHCSFGGAGGRTHRSATKDLQRHRQEQQSPVDTSKSTSVRPIPSTTATPSSMVLPALPRLPTTILRIVHRITVQLRPRFMMPPTPRSMITLLLLGPPTRCHGKDRRCLSMTQWESSINLFVLRLRRPRESTSVQEGRLGSNTYSVGKIGSYEGTV